MKNICSVVLLMIVFLSCTSKNGDLTKEIQGDWVSDIYHSETKSFQYVFSFEDTLCSYLSPFGEYTKFAIHGDTLLFKEIKYKIKDTSTDKRSFYFRILTLTEDSLVISPCSKSATELLQEYQCASNVLKFKKIKEKNKIHPARISFSSSWCFGECPEMMLEIDSNRNVSYFGEHCTLKTGGYKGTISKHEYEMVLRKIRALPIDSIKRSYSANWTDDQACAVIVDYDKHSLRSFVYGYDKEPIELRILFHKLMELYKTADLKKGTIRPSNFKYYKELAPPVIFTEPKTN